MGMPKMRGCPKRCDSAILNTKERDWGELIRGIGDFWGVVMVRKQFTKFMPKKFS